MKRPLAFLCLIATTVAFAQTTGGGATDAVHSAFVNFAPERKVRIRLQGTEKYGDAEMSIVGELYWSLDYDSAGHPLAKVEYTEWRDGIQVQRAVGDGKTYYDFAPLKNQYWVTSYGTHGPTPPARYLVNLVDNFTSSMKGTATYLGRFLREVYALNGFRAWIPGGSEFLITKDTPPTHDPVIEDRIYAGTDESNVALFWTGNPARKSLAFELGAEPSGIPKKIYFAEVSKVGDKVRVVDWTAQIFTGFIPAAEDFIFVPPANARPLTGPRPNIG